MAETKAGSNSAMDGGPSPTEGKGRVASIDVIRGVAVFGILLMNILAFGLPFEASIDPTVYGGHEGPNLWVWIINAMLIEGTQRGLFTVLFGAGVILFTQRMEASQRKDATDIYFRRNLWLVLFGIVHGFLLLWIGDILFAYGVIALFVYAFRKCSPKALVLIALGGLAFHAAWHQVEVYNATKAGEEWQAAVAARDAGVSLTSEQTEAIAAWEEIVESRKPNANRLQEVVDASRGSYFKQLAFQAPIRNALQIDLVYRYFFDMFSMMLVGMALFKCGLLHLGKPPGVYWRMVLIGYSIGLTVNFLEVQYLLAANFSVLALLHTDVTADVGRVTMTMGHVGLLMLLCNASILGGLKRRLAAVGRMAFTNYVSHSVICAFVFFGIGFGLFGQLQRYQLYYVVFAIWAFQLIVSPIWLERYNYGPLEWLWRALTYGKRPPMRRRRGSSIEPITAPLT